MTPKFSNPPIVEFVLGVQFAPLPKLSAAHFGLLWQKLGQDIWVSPGDGPVIQDQFESFDRPRWSTQNVLAWRVEPGGTIGRFTLRHRDKDKFIQFQNSRLHLNWRKSDRLKPSYHALVGEFKTTIATVCEFAKNNCLGEIAVNQWELTYVDAFARNEYWQTPADWASFLPGLFGKLFPFQDDGMMLEHRASEWSFEIGPKKARLHVTAQPGKWGDDPQDALIVTWTTRGPASNLEEAFQGFELGHENAMRAFLASTDEPTKNRWI